jgi:HemY protein
MLQRILSFIGWTIRLLALIGIVFWIYLHPGQITVNWQGQVIETSVGFATFVFLIVLFLFAFLYHGWRVLMNAPHRWQRWRHIRSLELGYKALNRGLLSVAAADSVNATKQAKKAQKLLPDFALTHLLSAQSAQLRGDDAEADVHLATLAQHPDGQLFGVRGQLTRALQRQDKTEALRLARQAHAQQPKQPWLIDTIVQLEARQKNWLNVEKILRQALTLNLPDGPRWQKDLAAALVALTYEARDRGDVEAALECAREAYRRANDWAPAAIILAQLWQRKAYRRRAQKIIAATWEKHPHPDLVKAWIASSAAERNGDVTDIVERLVRNNPNTYEAAMAMAQASLQERLWGVARQHAQRAIEYRADKGAYRMMATIELADSNDRKRAHIWNEKATGAPDEYQWVCRLTNETFETWQPLNRRLDFDTIIWQVPEQNIAAMPLSVETPLSLT